MQKDKEIPYCTLSKLNDVMRSIENILRNNAGLIQYEKTRLTRERLAENAKYNLQGLDTPKNVAVFFMSVNGKT